MSRRQFESKSDAMHDNRSRAFVTPHNLAPIDAAPKIPLEKLFRRSVTMHPGKPMTATAKLSIGSFDSQRFSSTLPSIHKRTKKKKKRVPLQSTPLGPARSQSAKNLRIVDKSPRADPLGETTFSVAPREVPIKKSHVLPERLQFWDWGRKRPRKEIDLKEWYCTDGLLQRIGQHNTGLTFLQVHRGRDRITDAGIVGIEPCRLLEELHISGATKVTDFGIDSFRRTHPKLRVLDLSGCKLITDQSIKLLASSCRLLQDLNVSGCVRLTDLGLKALSERPYVFQPLKRLNVSECVQLTDKGLLVLLQGARQIEDFDISNLPQLSDLGMMAFMSTTGNGSTPELKKLNMSYLKISRDGFGWVAEGVKKSLSHLDLSHCPGVDDGVLSLLGEHVRTLEELQLVNAQFITNQGIQAIGQQPQLRVLNITNCLQLTDEAFTSICINFPNLKMLYMEGITRISNMALCAVGGKLQLELVHQAGRSGSGGGNIGKRAFYGAPRISDVSITALAMGSTGATLRELCLAGLSRVTDASLKAIASHCKLLRVLSVAGCASITNKGVAAIAKRCTNIISLNLAHCSKLTDGAIEALGAAGLKKKKLLADVASKREVKAELETEIEKCEKMENFTLLMRAREQLKLVEAEMFALEQAAERLKPIDLTYINLSHLTWLRDPGMVALCHGVLGIRTLKVISCERLTDKTMVAIGEGLADTIVALDVTEVDEITDAGIKAVCDNCPNLLKLRCKGLTQIHVRKTVAAVKPLLLARCDRSTGHVVPIKDHDIVRARMAFDDEDTLARKEILKIQKLVRDFFSRRKNVAHAMFMLQQKKDSAKREMDAGKRAARKALEAKIRRFETSAELVQRLFRGHVGRERFKYVYRTRHAGAQIFQRNFRGSLARQLLVAMRLEKRKQFIKRQLGIKLIQKIYRGYRARMSFSILLEIFHFHTKIRACAAQTLQNWIRTMFAKKLTRMRFVEVQELLALKHRSALRIQQMYRGRMANVLLMDLKRLRRLLEHRSATVIQRNWRGVMGGQKALNLRMLLEDVAGDLQRVFRGLQGRKIFRYKLLIKQAEQARMEAAALVIQTHRRKMNAIWLLRLKRQRAWERKQRDMAARYLQKIYRGRKAYRIVIVLKKMKVIAKALAVVTETKQRRQHRMLQHGAAVTLQNWYREFLWVKAENARASVVREWATLNIQAIVRGKLARNYYKKTRAELSASATVVQNLWRMKVAKRRWGKLYRLALAEKREQKRQEKLAKIRRQKERRAKAERDHTDLQAVLLIQARWKIYVQRMREWREEERLRLEMEERVRLRQEERAKTGFDRLKERIAKATDAARKGAEALGKGLKGLKDGKSLKDIAKNVKDEMTPEETAMQKARRERLERQRKETAALERKAFLGDKAAQLLLKERKLARFSYSVMSNQKWAFNLKGITDIRMTVGPEESRRMMSRQAYYSDTSADAYVRVDGDMSYPKGGHGQMPQYAYLWVQKGLGATNLIGKIEIRRRREGEKKRELAYRNKKMKKKKQKFANDANTMIEFLLNFDSKFPIVDLKLSFDRKSENYLEDRQFEKVQDVDLAELVWGEQLAKHHPVYLWKYCLKIEKSEYQIELEGSTSAQPYYDAMVQKTMDFVALSEVEVEELHDIFITIDKDGTGFIEAQEFFLFLGVAPTEFHKCVFKYMDEDGDGTLKFGEFIAFACNIALLGNKQLFQILFGVIDTDDSGAISREELPALLDVSGCNRTIRKRITELFIKLGSKSKDGCLMQKEVF